MAVKGLTPTVVMIPASQQVAMQNGVRRQLRVAAYCRVSTDDEEQLTSYEAQKAYYTEKIMTNKEWTMAGIFADEGITGTLVRKRPEFLKMIRLCEQGKIDIVLVKSMSRFARNTVDSLNYIRKLKELGIAVIFEKEGINTLEVNSEVFLALHSAFAQGESESMSGNIVWGKRQAMREGRTSFQYKWLYGYKKGDDGEPEIIPEEAEIVREIYDDYLAGLSLRMIADKLNQRGIRPRGEHPEWKLTAVRSILSNEKYCGDALLQKTFSMDCISKKVVKNTGQLPMYFIKDHHEGIVTRQTYDAVKAEMARRNAAKSPSKKMAPTGLTSYTSKYALSDRLVCGKCGTLYRRCTWTSRGEKVIVWRCTSRLDYGKKYCKTSPTVKESLLQQAILEALNKAMSSREMLVREIQGALAIEIAPVPGETMSLSDIERRLEEITAETMAVVSSVSPTGQQSEEDTIKLKELVAEAAMLKEKRASIQAEQEKDPTSSARIAKATEALQRAGHSITQWDECMIRQLVSTVKVISATQIEVILQGGIVISQEMAKK